MASGKWVVTYKDVTYPPCQLLRVLLILPPELRLCRLELRFVRVQGASETLDLGLQVGDLALKLLDPEGPRSDSCK